MDRIETARDGTGTPGSGGTEACELRNQAATTVSTMSNTVEAAIGLTEAEAARRLAEYGENALTEHHVSALERLTRFFWGRSRG